MSEINELDVCAAIFRLLPERPDEDEDALPRDEDQPDWLVDLFDIASELGWTGEQMMKELERAQDSWDNGKRSVRDAHREIVRALADRREDLSLDLDELADELEVDRGDLDEYLEELASSEAESDDEDDDS